MVEPTYLLPIWDTITHAWHKVHGSKKTMWGAIVVILLIGMGLGIIAAIVEYFIPIIGPVVQVIISIVNFLLILGLMYIGIRRASDLPISYKMIFHAFNSPITLNAIGLYILQGLIFIIPILMMFSATLLYASTMPFATTLSILLYLVGLIATIYLAFRLYVAMAFVLDQNAGPIDAIKHSFKVTRGNVLRLFGLVIIEIIIFFISALPLLIGVIWTLPFIYILYGLTYKRLMVNLS